MPRPRFLSSLSFLLVITLLAGCAGSDRATTPTTDSTDPSPPAQTPSPTPRTLERPVANPISVPAAFQRAIEQGTRSETGRPGPNYWQQEATYDLTGRLYPGEQRLEGSGEMTYTNNSPNSLERLHMELIQNLHAEGAQRTEAVEVTGGMDIERVAYNGQELQEGRQPGYVVSGTQLVLFLNRPLSSGATADVEVDWSFTIPQQGASGRMGYSDDNLFYIGYWYPVFSVYDDVEGWYTEPFLGQAEFYLGYGDYEVTLEAPEEWFVMGTGRLTNATEVIDADVLTRLRQAHRSDETTRVIGEDDFGTEATRSSSDGRLTWRFRAEDVRDVAYSATRNSYLDATRTPVGDRDGDGETDYAQINTLYRPAAPLWTEVTQYQQHSITFHSEYTGVPYPWPHMTAVEGAGIIGGGMEFPMMTIMGDYNAYGDTALYNVTAHELAHMWVPMIVGTNERRHSWMDEGMTTFLENQARQDFYEGVDAEQQDLEVYTSFARQGQEGEMMRRSNYHYSSNAFVVASYMKPATMLTALRGLLGQDTFREAYQTFHQDWAFKHPTPYDFFNTFERVSGRDLDWFWRSFYFETWQMDQAVADVSQQNGETVIEIEDRGEAPMPVRVNVTLENGRTIQREVPVDVWLEGRTSTTLTLDTDSPVQRVEIDPEQTFPDVNRENNIWTRTS